MTSINLAKCNREVIDAQLVALELDANGSLKHVVSRLAKHFKQAENDGTELAVCERCGAESDVNLDHCPFCGEEGAVADAAPVASDSEEDEPEVHPVDDEEESGDPDDDSEEEESEEESEDEEESEEDDSEEEESDDSEEEESEEDDGEEEGDVMPVSAKSSAKVKNAPRKAPTAAKTAKLPPKGKANGKAPSAPGTALVKPPGRGRKAADPTVSDATAIVVVNSDALDEQIAVIHEAHTAGALASYRFGVAMRKIAEERLWKQRADDKGVPKFRSFEQFCKDELKLSKMTVHRALNVANNFTDEKQLEDLSGRQVRLILEVPKEARQEMLEAAKSGETGAKLSERADKLRGGREKLPEPKRGITVAMTLGHSKLKMYKRPTTGNAKIGDTEDAVRAKKIADGPWCVLDLSNKVRMLVRLIVDQKGELVADVEFRRLESAI